MTFWHNWFNQEAKNYCLRSTNSLILFGIRKNCLISGRSLLLCQFIKRVTKLTVIIITLTTSYKILSGILLSRLSPYIDELLRIKRVGFNITHQLLIKFFGFVKYWRKK
jgi:hypothetical protein